MTMRPPSSTLRVRSPRVRSPRVLDIFAAVCATVAVLLLVWPTPSGVVATAAAREPVRSTTSASVPPAVAPPALAEEAASRQSDSLIAVIVNANVFSATRKAPRVRFLPPGERAAIAEMPSGYAVLPPAVASTDSLPMRSGIVAINGERQALLQMTAADEAPKLYRINESHAGYRVVQIGPDLVVLASRAGTRTLRLSHRAPPDSLEKQP